jgi:DNA ligase (NAD+)
VDPAARVDQLRHDIEQHNYNYYVLDAPTISDAEYDESMRKLRELEQRYPELQTPDSPTMRVGGQVGRGFRPHTHPRPMLSLANAFSHEDLDSWFQRVRNLVPQAAIDFVVEPKIDGLAIALTYRRGRLRVGATRGNGIQGEDVTANLRTMSEVPDHLHGQSVPDGLEVRGEVYMPIQAFEALNQRRAEDGASLFANPRNSAAGSLRQLDPEVTRHRRLCLFAYAIGYADGVPIEGQWPALQLLRGWGFVVNPLVKRVDTLEEVKAHCDWMEGERDRLPYETDGVVVKINDVTVQEELGAVGREPRWAIAYKFAPREATTRLNDIQVNVGRTGAINPFAVLEPVNVGGVIVRLATLHNEYDIQRKDIRVGDRVIIRRAGDVIPQVVKPVLEERSGTEQVYFLPKACPACGTPLVRPEGEAMSRCPNIECPAQRFRWIEHFVSEPAMDIRGLGEALVQLLLDHGLIRDPADIYALTKEQLLTLPGIKEKSASNLLASIERSKRRPLANVVFALGIRYVGAQTAELLVGAFHDLDVIMSASVDALESVDGIGRKTAESIATWSAQLPNQRLLERLKSAGISWRERTLERVAAEPLSGTTVLITGRLEALSRGQAEDRLKGLGAKIAPGVSKAVDYLIVGAEPGSKLDKAKKLGTNIVDETWLLQVLQDQSIPSPK